MQYSPPNLLTILGIALLAAGIILIFTSFILTATREDGVDVEGGGVVFIGPIPVIFGTSSRMLGIMLIAALVFLALVILSFLGNR